MGRMTVTRVGSSAMKRRAEQNKPRLKIESAAAQLKFVGKSNRDCPKGGGYHLVLDKSPK